MSDLISRQAVLDSLKEHRALYCDNTPETFSKLSYAEKSRVDELDTAIATIINLPSVENKGDLISRAEVLKHKEILRDDNRTGHQAVKTKYIRELPSVENKGEDRPKGKWIYWSDSPFRWECDKCGGFFKTDFNFCPNCGADMRGEK